jgi:hypothetical protein
LPGLEIYLAEAGGFDMSQSHIRDSGSLELVLVDNSQSPRTSGVIGSMIPVIKIVVDDNNRVVVPAKRAPADIIISPIPVDPSRSPMIGGDPVPAQSQPPMPPAVMINTPAPGLIRNPGPADDGIPDPSSVIIGPPIRIIIHGGHPNVPVRPLVGPVAIGGELIFVVLELGGQIALRDILILQRIPAFIPIVKIIPTVRERGLRTQMPVRGQEPRPAAYKFRAFLACCFHRTFKDCKLAPGLSHYIKPVKPFLQDIKRCIRSVHLKVFLFLQVAYSEINISGEEVHFDPVIPLPWQVGEFNL